MLAKRLLAVEIGGGLITPRYLRSRDLPWVRALIEEIDAFVGEPVARLEEAWDAGVAPRLWASGAPRRSLDGALSVLRKSYPAKVRAVARPAELRAVVFEESARNPGQRAAALAAAATRLELPEADIEDGLFADLPGARVLGAPESPVTPGALIDAYNLALVQGVVMNALSVTAKVREHVRSVVRYAKLRGLMTTFKPIEDGTSIELSGPLVLFHRTTLYGHALASFLPTVLSTPGFEVEADCELGDERGICRIDAGAPLPRTHALPSASDSAVERRLARDIRKLGTQWSLRRETVVLQAGDELFFPDFSLTRGGETVLVEVVGYYTPEYLEAKLRKLREVRGARLIVCVDDSLACADREIVAREVLRFTKRIDAKRLLEAAERALLP